MYYFYSMPYNLALADRIRTHLLHTENVEEKAMMGGLTFMVNGKMCVGIIKNELMCRINPENHEEAVEKHGCRKMDFTARPMKGYVMIEASAIEKQKELAYWIDMALAFNPLAKASKKTK
jgi:TfoX/Sxy family transcriptional regulator of competence genes